MRKKTPTPTIDYGPVYEAHGYKLRFVENAARGLRRLGFADEVARSEGSRSIDHKGWFTHDDGDPDTVVRGVVYQLPARDAPQYVYGYADSENDGASLVFDDLQTDKLEAARAADRLAEVIAEHERDYHRAWDAGRRVESLDEDIIAARKEALAIAAEMRAARLAGIVAPTVCASLRKTILGLYRSIQKTRKERKELICTYGKDPGFVE